MNLRRALVVTVVGLLGLLAAVSTGSSSSMADVDTLAAAGFTADQEQMVLKQSEKHDFQSDVARTMKILVHSLYKAKEVFLRELISNASDALDKIRFLAVTDSSALGTMTDLNITVRLDTERKLIVITDTGVGMTKEELIKNLGTIAKSGTAEFLEAVANGTDNHLIGQFGVGFYSAYLVADKVSVISKNNADKQYIWESSGDNGFTIAADPRGNTLGRGTQVILHLRDEAVREFAKQDKLKKVLIKYSEFVNFPIYLEMDKTIEVEEPLPAEEIAKLEAERDEKLAKKAAEKEEKKEGDDATVEDVEDKSDEEEDEEKFKTTRTVTKDVTEWERMNPHKPIWTRDAKDVSEEEYHSFYKTFNKKDTEAPLAYAHFKAEGENEFRSMLFIPTKGPTNHLQSADLHLRAIRLFVRRVFITDELVDFLPRYLNFMTGMVDSDDLPLSVSRESLQESRLLKGIKTKVIKKALDLIKQISEDEEKYSRFLKEYSASLKLGVIEDKRNRRKLINLLRFTSSRTEEGKQISLDEYMARMKKGQEQIYYLTGDTIEDIKKSPFVERVIARGYEVLYMSDPIDEYVLQHVTEFDGKPLQNVAKDGLQLGDEDAKKQEEMEIKFAPLKEYLTVILAGNYNLEKVVISNRLTTSPCAIVAAKRGWSGRQEKMMNAQALGTGQDGEYARVMQMMHKKIFEINPRHPLIIKMLELKVDDKVEELRDAATLLFETTGIRSGFSMKDTNSYASLVEKLLRKHLGVDLEAAADVEEIAVAEELDESEKPVKPIETESDEDEVEEVDADDAAPKGFNVKVNNDLKDEPKEQVVQKIDMSKFKRNGESDDDEEDEDEDDNMHDEL